MAYVDFEPVAVAHSQELLAQLDGVSITRADVRDPASVLAAPTVTETLDFTRPIAVLAVTVMHFLTDADDPSGVLAHYRAALVPGKYLAMTHGSDDDDDPDLAAQMQGAAAVYRDSSTPGHLRDRPRIRELLGDLPLVEPGLVDINRWRNPERDAVELGNYAAVGRIP